MVLLLLLDNWPKSLDFSTSPFTNDRHETAPFWKSKPFQISYGDSLQEPEGGAEGRQVLAGPQPLLHVGWRRRAAAPRLLEHRPQHDVGHGELAPHEPRAPPESGVHGAEHGGSFFTPALSQLQNGRIHPAIHEGCRDGVMPPAEQREQEAGNVPFALDGTHPLDAELHLSLWH